jgi:hypothetical protein
MANSGKERKLVENRRGPKWDKNPLEQNNN